MLQLWSRAATPSVLAVVAVVIAAIAIAAQARAHCSKLDTPLCPLGELEPPSHSAMDRPAVSLFLFLAFPFPLFRMHPSRLRFYFWHAAPHHAKSHSDSLCDGVRAQALHAALVAPPRASLQLAAARARDWQSRLGALKPHRDATPQPQHAMRSSASSYDVARSNGSRAPPCRAGPPGAARSCQEERHVESLAPQPLF